jgi:ABC-type nitrate/sulfonate/bicarbonate transport system substrate-binding protein
MLSPPATTSEPLPAAGGAPEVRDVSMRLQWIPQYQFAGYIVAKVQGYYEEAGLNVELYPGSPDFVPLPMVVGGADTFGSTGADTLFLAREKDIRVVALATIFQASPVGFMVHSDSDIEGPEDFVGKRVGVFYGDNVETEYRALLAAAGVERSRINEVPAQFNLEPFLSRRVDVWPVYVTDQPDLARQQGARVNLILARDYGVMLMGDVLFATETFVHENPNTTRAFVHATLRGWEYALENPQETVELIADYSTELSLQHLSYEARETVELVQHGVGATCPGWNDRARWEAEQKVLKGLSLLEETIPIDEVIDNRFVASYYEEQGVLCKPGGP